MTGLNRTVLLRQFKILLLGDTCEDVYHYGTVDRISPEAPVPVFVLKRVESKLGMGYNVKYNLKAFNCSVDFLHSTKEITKKTRVIDEHTKQHLIRIDEDVPGIPPNLNRVNWKSYDAVVISDYNKGAITEEVILEVQKKFKGPIFVDTKKTDLSKFNKCVFKINALEFSKLIKPAKEMVITRGANGTEYKGKVYPVSKVEVVDVCGAGDTFLAALTWGYLHTKSMVKAISIANKCASVSVTHSGVYTLTESDIETVLALHQ
jgi:D-glycero-beta-D-manno-heptose-7-phosphate kinase